MFLVDTCALSEFTKPRPAETVERWFERTDDALQFVSVLTFGELEKGVRKLPPGKRRDRLEGWLADLTRAYAIRTLDVSLDVARAWGRLSTRAEAAGSPLPVVDSLIAATGLAHDLTVVTRNTAHMTASGVRVLDPWAT